MNSVDETIANTPTDAAYERETIVNLTPEQREKRRQQGIANMAKMQASREKSAA